MDVDGRTQSVYENSMETSQRRTWRVHGISLDVYKSPLLSMDLPGHPWVFIRLHGVLMDLDGPPWTSMDLHGSPPFSMVVDGCA